VRGRYGLRGGGLRRVGLPGSLRADTQGLRRDHE